MNQEKKVKQWVLCGLGEGQNALEKIEKVMGNEYKEKGLHRIGGIRNPLPTIALMSL